MKRIFALTLILAVCLAAAAAAEMPQLLSYQGVLTDGSGVAVPDDTYSITFRIYNVGAAGARSGRRPTTSSCRRARSALLLGTTAMLASFRSTRRTTSGCRSRADRSSRVRYSTATPYSFLGEIGQRNG